MSFFLRVGILLILFCAITTAIFICISRFALKRTVAKSDICRLVFMEYIVAWTIVYVFFRIEMLSFGLHLERMTLRPFESYAYAFNNFSASNWFKVFRTTIGLVPFGLLYPLAAKHGHTLPRTLCFALIFSVSLEFAMLFLNMGQFHIDHILNGVLGAVAGYCIYALLSKKVCAIKSSG